MSGVTPATVNQIAHDRMELLQRVIPALAKQTTSASVNEVPGLHQTQTRI